MEIIGKSERRASERECDKNHWLLFARRRNSLCDYYIRILPFFHSADGNNTLVMHLYAILRLPRDKSANCCEKIDI